MIRVEMTAIVCVLSLIAFSSTVEDFAKRVSGSPISMLAVDPLAKPGNGVIYECRPNEMKVVQCVDGYAIVVAAGLNGRRKFAIRTQDTYADGDMLNSGYYRCLGVQSFTRVLGAAESVYCFEPLSKDLGIALDRELAARAKLTSERRRAARQSAEVAEAVQKSKTELEAERLRLENDMNGKENQREIARIKQKSQEEISKLKEAALKRDAAAQQAFEEELAAKKKAAKPQEQETRKLVAEKFLLPLDFNLGNYFCIQKSCKKFIEYGIVDEENLWGRLKEKQDAKDWLGMLSILLEEDIDEYPDEDVIKKTVEEFKNKGYAVYVKWLPGGKEKFENTTGKRASWLQVKVPGAGSGSFGRKEEIVIGKDRFECFKPMLTERCDIKFPRYCKVVIYFGGTGMPDKFKDPVGFENWMRTH